MKTAIVTRLLLPIAFVWVSGQLLRSEMIAPSIQWQRSFGGTGSDLLRSVQQTSDGGYILGGYSNSTTNGNKTSPNFGWWDYWIIRLDGEGNERWQKSFGGTSNDFLEVVCQTRDGGYLLGGHSISEVGGTKTAPNYGAFDFWIIRLDADGHELWQQTFGGTENDQLFGLDETSDGGWILGGTSASSTNGNKAAPNWGLQDFWAVRLDGAGNKLWDQSCGGSSTDVVTEIGSARDGGFLLAGYTRSGADGTKTSPRLGFLNDIWVACLDSEGGQLWDRAYRVLPRYSYWEVYDQVLESFDRTPDDGFLLGGPVAFSVPPQFGKTEFGVVRIDADGNELWQRCLTRKDTEYLTPVGDFLYSVRTLADTGFLLGGTSGFPFEEFLRDFWLLRVDENGEPLWNAQYGGLQSEEIRSVSQTSDGGFIIGGPSVSEPARNKTAPSYGSTDFWVLKLAPESPRLKALQVTQAEFSFALFPGTTNHAYRIDHSTNLIDWVPSSTNYPRTYKVQIGAPKPRTSTSFYRVERLP